MSNQEPGLVDVPVYTPAERYKLQAAFWHSVALSAVSRNILLGFESGDLGRNFREVLAFAVTSGMSSGIWMDDVLDTEGMGEEEIAWRTENRKDMIPWSIVKECCDMWGVDPDPLCNAFWQDMQDAVNQNRAFLGLPPQEAGVL